MGKPIRALANIQTAALVNKIFEDVNDALLFREAWVEVNGKNFTGIGLNFAETLECKCAKAEGINWLEVDEVMQYGILPDKVEKIEEVVVEANVVEAELPDKVLDVADKVADDAKDQSEINEEEDEDETDSESFDEVLKNVSEEVKESVDKQIKELDEDAKNSEKVDQNQDSDKEASE